MSDQQQNPSFTAPTPPAFTPPQAPPFQRGDSMTDLRTPPADDPTPDETDDEPESPEPNDHARGLGVTGKFPVEPTTTDGGDEQ